MEPAKIYPDIYAETLQRDPFLFYLYNMSDRYATDTGRTAFTGMTGSDYTYTESTWERAYDTSHYSKVAGELERAAEFPGRELREAVFTLRHRTTSSRYATVPEEGYLLVAPFRLKQYPVGSGADRGSDETLRFN